MSIKIWPSLYSTNLVVSQKKGPQSMTVGIGALCESGGCVILGSDTRGSYEKVHNLGPNDWTSKVYDLPHGCFMSVAGTLSDCHGVSSQITIEFGKLGNNFELDEARRAINDARFYEYCQIAGDRIHAKFGLSLSEWHKLPRDAAVYQGGVNIFKRIPLNVEIIVAGFKNKNPQEVPAGSTAAILFRAIGKHRVEAENNFATIGSGGKKARRVLDYRGQNVHRSWQRTAIDVIAAIRAARRESKRYIGTPDDLILIFCGQTKRFPVRATFVNSLLEKTKKSKIANFNSFDQNTNTILDSLLYDQPSA